MPSPAAPKPKARPVRTAGQNIQHHRKRKHWTQQQLALAIGLNSPNGGAHISRIEAGAQQPRLSTLRRLCKALGVGIADLVS